MQESSTGYFTYQPPDSDRVIHLSLDAVDSILAEIMTGFGAIPRRGAEVGGLLLGRQVDGSIWIDGFAMVASEHRLGPSYLLSDRDRELFSETFDHHRAQEAHPVGVFRSNTRDSNSITDEDREWFGKYFPAPSGTFLLVRPYASKTSTATFLVYRNGALEESGGEPFPFVRWELEGGAPPQRRPLGKSRLRQRGAPTERTEGTAPASPTTATQVSATASGSSAVVFTDVAAEAPPAAPEAAETRRRRHGWIWVPVSFLFLALGVLLGIEVASLVYPSEPVVDGATFALGLAARARDEAVHIQWNRTSPAVRTAWHGRLEIRDSQYTKIVELDPAALQTGSVIYPLPVASKLSLRLELTIRGNTTVTETLDWWKNPNAP